MGHYIRIHIRHVSVYLKVVVEYRSPLPMSSQVHGRHGQPAGMTCQRSICHLRPNQPGGYKIPFDNKGLGCLHAGDVHRTALSPTGAAR